MKRLFSIMLCIILICGMPAMPAQASESVTPSGVALEDVDRKIELMAKKNKEIYASFATAVFQGDEVIFEKHFGYIDRENQIPADETSVYEWGSVSKLFVWISVLQLYEQGKIDLEADVRKYLPEDFFQKLKYEDTITMLHLMNHNAGWEETSLPMMTEKEEELLSLEEALRTLEPVQVFRPGEITAYSNWGTALAGYIVEQVSGMEYTEYVQKNILTPLGMEQTAVSADYRDNEWVRKQREKQKCYLIQGDETLGVVADEELGTAINYIQIYPAGSVTGTLADITKFARTFVDEDCPLFEKQETLEFMLSASDYYGDSEIPKNCHGLWCTEYAVRTLGHAGNTLGGSAQLMFDRESQIGVVVLTNQQYETLFCYGIPEMIFGSIEENPIYKNATITQELDVSGDYVASRGLFEGSMKIHPGISYLPFRTSEEAKTFNLLKEPALIQFGDRLFRAPEANDFFYVSTTADGEQILECSSVTYMQDDTVGAESAAVTIFVGISLVSLILMVMVCGEKVLKPEEKMPAVKWIVAGQVTAFALGMFLFTFRLDIKSIALFRIWEVVSGGVGLAGMVVCLLSAVATLKAAITTKDMKAINRLKYLAYVLCNLYVVGFLGYFRLFGFRI